MMLDSQLQFSDAQALSATAVATNVIDLTSSTTFLTREIGSGETLRVMFQVDVTADVTTQDETYQFDVEYATNAAQTTGRQLIGRRIYQGTTVTAPNQPAALLVAGFIFYIDIPPMQRSESARFLGVRYVLSGTTPTITVTSFLTGLGAQSANAYPSGFTVT